MNPLSSQYSRLAANFFYMLKHSFILLALCLTNFANGQNNIKKYVPENTVQIKTVQPDSINFSDLEIFGNSIGDSKIVMLGEQDYGDAPTFLAKTRLIKYLREKKRFNVKILTTTSC